MKRGSFSTRASPALHPSPQQGESLQDAFTRTAQTDDGTSGLSDEYLEGVDQIAKYLGWNTRKVRYARETGALPIRVKNGVGIYAFKSEILAALKTPDTLVPKSSHRAH